LGDSRRFCESGWSTIEARMDSEQPTLTTEQLVLRPLEMADADTVQQLAGIHRHAVRKWDVFEDVAQYAILVTERKEES
jgi:hypothetical protein